MNELVARVLKWRDRLREVDPGPCAPHLSPEGARLALDVALDELRTDDLREAATQPGEPFATATFIAARTVFTAPLEWCAVLLARGTHVTLKHPEDVAGLAPTMAQIAQALDLPLSATADRAPAHEAELVVAMGADATVEELKRTLPPHVRFLGFGHRFSVALATSPEGLALVAQDAAPHDGGGCMSPAAVFTTLPLAEALEPLAEAMAEAQARWPRGALARADAAAIRSRMALARASGDVRVGDAYCVMGLPIEHFSPVSLPRALTVHHVASPDAMLERLGPDLAKVSTIGTDAPDLLGQSLPRICLLGRMQRPPLRRRHDGVDWLRATIRA